MARKLQLRPYAADASGNSENYDKQLKQALADRDQFLEEHPDYIPYQREIDSVLSKAGSTENRMVVLAVMMEAKLSELAHHFQDLSEMVTAQLARHRWALSKVR